MFCSFVGSCPVRSSTHRRPAQPMMSIGPAPAPQATARTTCHPAFSGFRLIEKKVILQQPPSDGLNPPAHDYSSWYLRVAAASADAASSNRKHRHAGTSTRVSTALRSSPSPPCNPARGELPKERPSLASRSVRIPTRRSLLDDLSVGASVPPRSYRPRGPTL